jgi:hypothetical protein
VLAEIVFGARRGMLWVAPAMILAPFGLYALIRTPATRDVGILAAAVAVTAFLYNAAYVYWDGGNSTGPRHAVPALGFLALGIGALWAGGDRWERGIAGLLLGASMAINLMIASTEIMAPAQFDDPLREYNWMQLFLPGVLRTLPNEFWGWTPWGGFRLYLLLAAALAILLVLAWRKDRLTN